MSNLPTGTVTLLFTDIEGSTRLLQQLGDRYASVLEDCRQLIRTAIARWNGHEAIHREFILCSICAIYWPRKR